MAIRTPDELVRQALLNLRVLASNEVPSAEDSRDVLAVYGPMLAELRARGLAYWPEAEIPNEVFMPLSQILASEVAGMFGKEYSPGDAGTRLTVMASVGPSYEPQQSESF